MLSEVYCAFPESLAPIIGRDLDRTSTVGPNFPDAGGKESIDEAIVGHSTSDVSPVLLAQLLVLTGFQVNFVDVVGAQDVAFGAYLDHHFGISPGCVLQLLPFPRVLDLAKTSSPISSDADCITFVGNSPDAVTPVALSIGLVLSILKVHAVQSIIVHDQGFVIADYAGIAGIVPAIVGHFIKTELEGVTCAFVDAVSVEAQP